MHDGGRGRGIGAGATRPAVAGDRVPWPRPGPAVAPTALCCVAMLDAVAPTDEPTIANVLRELKALRDRLAGIEERVYQCQCMLVRIDGNLAWLASRVDDLAR
jgi:hypothetical protein